MADDIEVRGRADDYRERAQLLRRAAGGGLSAETQHRLLEIADEFDDLADGVERARFP